jgi:hypothetical protein
MNSLIKKLIKIDFWFDYNFGYFFTNGRKFHIWEERIRFKMKRIESI